MALHTFTETHIEEDCSTLTGTHDNGLFYNCRFEKLNGLTLRDCDLNGSQFTTDSIADALGISLTLSCKSFRGVTLSPLLFDLYLLMAVLSKGNDQKRAALLDVIGKDRAAALLQLLKVTE